MGHQHQLVLVELDPLDHGLLDAQQAPPLADITHAVLLITGFCSLTAQKPMQETACASLPLTARTRGPESDEEQIQSTGRHLSKT